MDRPSGTRPRTAVRRLAPALALACVAACGSADAPAGSPVAAEIGPLRVVDATLVDGDGRQVLLHGTGLLNLGDYYQGDPRLPTTPPLTAADWDLMADYGFSAVRTVVSWSALEPARGAYDAAALARVRQAVDDAAQRGIYTVLDVHQDAWGRFIATPEGVTCPSGLEPAIGWDGAPEWATFTDGKTTCRPPGYREGSEAVQQAFRNFYDNREGIADAFVALWARLAEDFAGRPGVGGFDLLNEPVYVFDWSADDMRTSYTDLMGRTIAAIRAVEARKGVPPTPIFLEPVVMFPIDGTLPDRALLDDDQRVFSPHVYPGVLSREATLVEDARGAAELQAPLWIGEFSFGDDSEAGLAEIRTFLEACDRARAGTSWWVFQTGCGDPHFIGVPRADLSKPPRTGVDRHLKTSHCPGGESEPTTRFLELAGRSYPRLSPGRLDAYDSDLLAGTMALSGRDAVAGQRLVAWLVARGGAVPAVRASEGLGSVEVTPFGRGAWLTAVATGGAWSLQVGPVP